MSLPLKKEEIVISAWRASGILDAVAMSLTNMPQLDPFQDIDLVSFSVSTVQVPMFPEAGHADINERCDESDSETEYILDDMHDDSLKVHLFMFC